MYFIWRRRPTTTDDRQPTTDCEYDYEHDYDDGCDDDDGNDNDNDENDLLQKDKETK